MEAQIVMKDGYVKSPYEVGTVTVKAEIRLPAKDGLLIEEIQFGRRIYILGEQLWREWGQKRNSWEYRFNRYGVSADTFSEATKKAIERGKEELAKLQKALMERREKIRKAGNFESKIVNIQL